MGGATYRPEDVTVAVLNYNGIDIVPDLLRSIEELPDAPCEVLFVDDGSTDESPAWVRSHFPRIRIVEMGRNTGVLNVVRNRALREARGRLVFMIDNDVILTPDCLDQLLAAMNALPGAAACTTRAVYVEDPETIYQDGQTLHYVGASPGPNRDRPVSEADTDPRVSIGWGVQLLDRRTVLEAGGFNEDYLLGWGDDGELNHRLHLFGHCCYHVPRAVVLHRRQHGSRRFYAGVLNRWRFILETYHLKTILLSLPAMIVYELAVLAFLLGHRRIGDYFRALLNTLRRIPSILHTRRRVQRRRQVRDGRLMGAEDIFVYRDYVTSRPALLAYRALNGFLAGYWRCIRRFV